MIPIFGALICKWKGHRRGILMKEMLAIHPQRKFFECPRCGRVTSYKPKDGVVAPLKAVG